jgi:hypothetical protein
MMCHKMGRFPIGTIGLGRSSVSSRMRVPSPPHNTKTGMSEMLLVTRTPKNQARPKTALDNAGYAPLVQNPSNAID